MDDLNKFEHGGQISEGCQSGQHLFNHNENDIGVGISHAGVKCTICGTLFEVPGIDSEQRDTKQVGQNIDDTIEQSDVLKRLLF